MSFLVGHSGSCPTWYHFDAFIQQNAYFVLHGTEPRGAGRDHHKRVSCLPRTWAPSEETDGQYEQINRRVRGCEACQEADERCQLVNGGREAHSSAHAQRASLRRDACSLGQPPGQTLRKSDDPVAAKGKGEQNQ